jgi:small nuclear ribonucleoprotein (snRNP)-like protein
MMTDPPKSNATTNSNKKAVVTSSSQSKSLGSVLRYMEGMEMIVELKTGQRHRGILTSADEFMNLTLSLVERKGTEQDHPPSKMQDFHLSRPKDDDDEHSMPQNDNSTSAGYHTETLDDVRSSVDIRGPKIRYIHFPDNSDLTSMVTMGVERERIAAKKYNRGKRK